MQTSCFIALNGKKSVLLSSPDLWISQFFSVLKRFDPSCMSVKGLFNHLVDVLQGFQGFFFLKAKLRKL